MSIDNESKINKILQGHPRGTVLLSSFLKSQGISHALQQRYRKSGWFELLGKGAMVRTGEHVDWLGALYSLQKYANLPIHVGGRTAINMQGLAHYLELSPKKIILFAPRKIKLPNWFIEQDWGVEVLLHNTDFLPPDLGMRVFREGLFDIQMSNPARALMECLYLSPEKFGLMEAYQIMEGLFTFPPELAQNLLENCHSIKVKRLFLFMAETLDHPWYKYLNLGKINLGSGTRSLAAHGVYNDKYKLVLPKELLEENDIQSIP